MSAPINSENANADVDAAGDDNEIVLEDPAQETSAAKLEKEPETVEIGEDVDKRDKWANQFEFLFSLISMSVGLGNVWRFPVVASANGGGAFLIPYLTVLIFVGRPIYFMELSIGQFSSQTQVGVWNCCPILKGVGISAMMSTIAVLTYYTSVLSLISYYFVESFFPVLPWTRCAREQPNCSSENISTAESHLKKDVLHQKDNINYGIGYPEWKLTLCLLIAWLAIYFSLIKGVKSSGKVAYCTAIFPYVVLLTLLIRGVTLEGAGIGIIEFIKPDFAKLLEPKVWYMATSQAFFSLNAAFGSVIMFASYNPFRQNIYRDALILSVMDTLTSFIAGITVFSVMGFLSVKTGKPVSTVVNDGGPGIAFVAYPTAISELPWPNFFAVLFFMMLFALGLGSSAADAGAIISIIADQYPNVKRWKITSAVCGAAFLVGILYVTEGGQFVLYLVDFYGASFSIFLVAILETAGIAYVYKLSNFTSDIEFMLHRKLGWYWKICWYGIIPVGLTFVLIYSMVVDLFGPIEYEGVPYPVSACSALHNFDMQQAISLVSGWLLAVICLSPLVICAVQEICGAKGTTFLEKVKVASQPKPSWGPRDPKDRAEWQDFKKEHGRT